LEVGHGRNINRYLETFGAYSRYRATPAYKSRSPVDTSYESSAFSASWEWRSIPIEKCVGVTWDRFWNLGCAYQMASGAHCGSADDAEADQRIVGRLRADSF
jgi:hypothetical protein